MLIKTLLLARLCSASSPGLVVLLLPGQDPAPPPGAAGPPPMEGTSSRRDTIVEPFSAPGAAM